MSKNKAKEEENEPAFPFKKWILNFVGIDLPIGKVADYVAKDDNFPVNNKFVDILEYLQNNEASDECITDFCQVWDYFNVTTESNSSIYKNYKEKKNRELNSNKNNVKKY